MHYTGLAAKLLFDSGAPFPFKCHNRVSLFPAGYPALFPGDIGPFVFVMQDALLTIGFAGCSLDGFFGNRTTDALLSFKANHHLTPTPVCDKETFDILTFLAAGSGINDAIKYVKKQI